MSRTLIPAFAFAVLLLGICAPMAIPAAIAARAPSAATTFEVDTAHSTIIYRVRHFDVSNFYGRINAPKGSFTINAASPDSSSIDIAIEISNMDAGNDQRDAFLKGADFFNAREYPAARFRSTSFEKVDERTFNVIGEFTMRGVTKPVTVRLTDYTETQTDRFGYRGGFEARFIINRSEFGMTKMIEEKLLGDEVLIIASIEGVKVEDE